MFPQLINSLLEAGVSEIAIAARVNTTQASINRIRNGKQRPLYELGRALCELGDEVCPSWRDTLEVKSAAA